jgi:hypothetical protein
LRRTPHGFCCKHTLCSVAGFSPPMLSDPARQFIFESIPNFYSIALFRRRQMIMNSTTTAITPQTNRIKVSIFILLYLFCFIRSKRPVQPPRPRAAPYLKSGNNVFLTIITAGPKIVSNSAGKIKNTRTGTIFTLTFALISSAR